MWVSQAEAYPIVPQHLTTFFEIGLFQVMVHSFVLIYELLRHRDDSARKERGVGELGNSSAPVGFGQGK